MSAITEEQKSVYASPLLETIDISPKGLICTSPLEDIEEGEEHDW